ncbi:MAG: hypothetical protein WCK51_06225 [Armatimonadota bacterium]
MMNTRILIGVAAALVGQVALANSEGSQSLQLRYTAFGGAESLYRSYTYRASNADGSSFHLKAVQSLRETTGAFPAINTGGNDIEFGITANIADFNGTYSLGFAFPNTFADNSTSFVYAVTRSLSDTVGVSIKGFSGATSANAFFVNKNFKLNNSLSFDAEVGVIITGYSTVDETTGAAKRNALVNARLNYQLSEMLNAFVGVTNTLGDSTRFSLNSSVGNKMALTFGIGGKF